MVVRYLLCILQYVVCLLSCFCPFRKEYKTENKNESKKNVKRIKDFVLESIAITRSTQFTIHTKYNYTANEKCSHAHIHKVVERHRDHRWSPSSLFFVQ